ncbi:MAG: hypothetical protein IPP81_10605 [Chitinophagaceae bacterium]|nr:hypothetical protein [Chitinophagaceae bacterium]
MKSILLIVVSFCISTTLFAQDANYTGPAKTYVTGFYKQAEEAKKSIETQKFVAAQTKVDQMDRAITSIKSKDASYNTASMEVELKKIKEQLEAAKNTRQSELGAGQNATRNRIKIKQLLNELFDFAVFSVRFAETAQATIDTYKAKTQEFLDMKDAFAAYKTDEKEKEELKRFIDKMKLSHTRNFDTFLERVQNILSQSTGEKGGNWEIAYYELQGEQAHWDAAVKVFPEEPEFDKAYQKITAAVNKYGNIDNIYAKTQVNKVEKIKNTKLPPATVKDASLEKILINGFNSKYGSVYKGTALKAVLTQDGWTIERNSLTGIVTGRNRTGKIAYKGTDGKCYLLSNNIFIYQAFIGNSFSNTEVIYNGLGGEEMLCENVK